MYLATLPDIRVPIEDIMAEGDKVAVRWMAEGTHQGELLGIPPTGKRIQFSGISIYRLAEGKVAEVWEQIDMLSFMQRLGMVVIAGPRLLVRTLVRQAKRLRSRLPARRSR